MIIELNINNYCAIYELFNGVDFFFKTTIEPHLTFEIWIEFSNLKIGQHTHTIFVLFLPLLENFQNSYLII
jgi:hypothetical protein